MPLELQNKFSKPLKIIRPQNRTNLKLCDSSYLCSDRGGIPAMCFLLC